MTRSLLGFWKFFRRRKEDRLAKTGPFIRPAEVKVSIGLDFGTHATKAAFFQFGGPRVVRAVRFHRGLDQWPDFALPAVGIIRDNALVWGIEAASELDRMAWSAGIRRLKVLLAATSERPFADHRLSEAYQAYLQAAGVNPVEWQPEHVATASLALQIMAVRREVDAFFDGRRVDAQCAVPVPIDHAQNSALLARYYRVINASQRLVHEDGTLQVGLRDLVPAAADAFRAAPESEVADGRIFTLPEAVAQIASYLTSLEREPGVHGVIDIGAGTTDVSIFRLLRPGDHGLGYFWYSASAIPRASAAVQQAVLDALAARGQTDVLTEGDLMRQMAAHGDIVRRELEGIRRLTNANWTEAYNHFKKPSEWQRRPLFLCGGGALLPEAASVFRQSWMTCNHWEPHVVRELPVPRDYEGNGVPFSRMAVAYGLAIPKPQHGSFVLPKDSPDHTPEKRYKRYEGAGGDQLYPTPGWV